MSADRKCNRCHGLGHHKCGRCKGYGGSLRQASIDEQITGICRTCKGRGCVDCTECGAVGVLPPAKLLRAS